MQYKGNDIWVEYGELVPHIMSAENYRQTKGRGGLRASCVGGNGRVILIEFASLSKKYQQAIIDKYGDPKAYIAMNPLKTLVEADAEARRYYADYRLPNGKFLPLTYQLKYVRQAEWLGAIKKATTNKAATKDTLNVSMDTVWKNFSHLINKDETDHELPTSVDRLRRRYKLFYDKGYAGIVEAWRFGNDFARKVTGKIENLILALYAQPYKPYMSEVCRDYRLFITGEKTVVDIESGEMFDPKDFYVDDEPYKLGESTVDYYIKQPGNQAIINKGRMKGLDFNTQFRPSVKRLSAFYAFSKISMDDVDIPFKTPDGDRAVKSYQIFDTASGAVVGVAFGRDKNVELIREALRDMFRLIIRNGWGVPWEIEFEKHLTSAMTGGTDQDGVPYEDVLTPGAVFPATRMCLGGNAKEKRAEGFIRVKKYQQQKKRLGFQARHYARLLTNRLNPDQDTVRYQYNEIVQNELNDIATHNNELHPKQDLYPGMTRWEVLVHNQNPNLAKYQPEQVIQFIGYRTETSIRAGAARVQYNDYMLPDMHLIMNQHYNGKIEAYYLPDDKGEVNSVYLFENGTFLCEAKKKDGFQEAIIEQTADDKAIQQRQWGQQKQFDKIVRDGRAQIPAVGTVETKRIGEGKRLEASGEIVRVQSFGEAQDDRGMAKIDGVNAEIIDQKSPKKAELEGGYCPENDSIIDQNAVAERAKNRASSMI